MADTEINDSTDLSVADMMGQVEPAAVSDFEAGKVELSVPRKYIPVKKEPKKQPEAKPKLPLGKAVPVFRTETYVDDDGIEHMMPPSYDKSKMNLPQAKFKRPENMSMIRDDEVVAEQIRQEEAQKAAQEETPDFIREWQNSSSDADNEVNDILDDDGVVDLAIEGEDEEPDVSEKTENSLIKPEDDILVSGVDERDNQSELLSAEEDAEFDMDQINKLLAEQSEAEPKDEVLELGVDDLLGDGEQRAEVEEQHVIPKFEIDDVESETSPASLPMLEVEPVKEITEEKIPTIEAEPVEEVVPEVMPIIEAEPAVEAEPIAESAPSVTEEILQTSPEEIVETPEPIIEAEPAVEAEPIAESAPSVTEEILQTSPEDIVEEPEPTIEAEPIKEVVAEEAIIDEAKPEEMPSVEAKNEEPRTIELEPAALSALVEKIDDVPSVEDSSSPQQQLEEASLFVRQYSGHLDDSYFVVSAKNLPEEFVGAPSQNSIQINVGTSDYGWSVLFANGILMGIADVRMFQLKHGKLPATGGMLMYGTKKMKFSEVERIVLYQSPQYFSYV